MVPELCVFSMCFRSIKTDHSFIVKFGQFSNVSSIIDREINFFENYLKICQKYCVVGNRKEN